MLSQDSLKSHEMAICDLCWSGFFSLVNAFPPQIISQEELLTPNMLWLESHSLKMIYPSLHHVWSTPWVRCACLKVGRWLKPTRSDTPQARIIHSVQLDYELILLAFKLKHYWMSQFHLFLWLLHLFTFFPLFLWHLCPWRTGRLFASDTWGLFNLIPSADPPLTFPWWYHQDSSGTTVLMFCNFNGAQSNYLALLS